MLRLLLTLLWLLNYLLVVWAGLLVSRSPESLYTAAHPYVHSKDCQQRNYLRLDCFEHCNGDQHELRHRPLPTGTGLHYVAQLKGLDVHFASTSVAGLPIPANWQARASRPALPPPTLPTRPAGHEYPPPQRG